MRKTIFLLFMLALLGLVLSGCGFDKTGTAEHILSSATQTTGGKNERTVYLMAGKIDADVKADISSKITARVAAINVDVGSVVKKGEVIISLDSNDLAAQAAQAKAVLDGAATSYQNAKSNYERNDRLYHSGLISKSLFEQYQTTFATAEGSFKSAQAALEFARTQLDKGTIVSPIYGIISAKNIQSGELAVAGVPLVTVVSPADIIINAYLPARLIDKVKIGQKVIIKVSEIPDQQFGGEITVINSVIDSKSKNILVKVKFSKPLTSLRPGMFAEIGL
jgi:HlyD family secretion protein